MVSSNLLALKRTKFANQRTYLAYMRTGFSIAGIAGHFNHFYVALFGVSMIIVSTAQYQYINYNLDNDTLDNNEKIFDYAPLIYLFLSLLVLYLQYIKKNL